jgi:hypothetical protein
MLISARKRESMDQSFLKRGKEAKERSSSVPSVLGRFFYNTLKTRLFTWLTMTHRLHWSGTHRDRIDHTVQCSSANVPVQHGPLFICLHRHVPQANYSHNSSLTRRGPSIARLARSWLYEVVGLNPRIDPGRLTSGFYSPSLSAASLV